MLLKVAICEDDPTQAKNVRRMVEDWGEARGQKTTVYPYAGCEAFLTDWMESMDYDLLLLDIDLGGGMNGMELARHIRRKDTGITIGGGDEEAGGVPVDPVDDPRPQLASDP